MPTERKVLALLDRRNLVPALEGEFHAEGELRAELRSALDKEGAEREEYRVSYTKQGDVIYRRVKEAALAVAGECGVDARVQSRTITTFEDGAEHRTAWRDLEGEDV